MFSTSVPLASAISSAPVSQTSFPPAFGNFSALPSRTPSALQPGYHFGVSGTSHMLSSGVAGTLPSRHRYELEPAGYSRENEPLTVKSPEEAPSPEARRFLEDNEDILYRIPAKRWPSNLVASSDLTQYPPQESETAYLRQRIAVYEKTISQLWHKLNTSADVLENSARLLDREPPTENIQSIQIAQRALHSEIQALREHVRVQHAGIGTTDVSEAERNT